jgi:hypothetical protein
MRFTSIAKCVCAAVFILFCSFTQAQEKDKKEDQWPKYKFKELPDSTYGKGGRILIDTAFFKDGSYKVNIGYRDKNGKFRQNTEVFYNSEEGTTTTTEQFFDNNDKKTKETVSTKNRIGDETYNREEFYKDGVIESGDIYRDIPGGKGKEHLKYNPDTQKYEPVKPAEGKGGNKGEELFKPDFDITGFLFLGGGFISEDAYPKRFVLYGGSAAYTRVLSRHIGITGDLTALFGNHNQTDYTKWQLMAGASYLPDQTASVFFAPYIVAGVTHVKSEYQMSAYKYSGTALSMAAGTVAGVHVNKKIEVAVKADYNPTFFDGNMENEYRIFLGIRLDF